MKKIIVMLIGLLAQQIAQAQGMITFLSSLSPTSTGSLPVASDYWLAAGFKTGNNVGGYMLNSIRLGMTNAIGNPSSFAVMIYSSSGVGGNFPGSSLDVLNGSDNPSTAGTYTFAPSSTFVLSPSSYYFIVLTAGTAVANGAYEWSESAFPPSINTWGAGNGVFYSRDGVSNWSTTQYSGIAQFAITATAVPEPSSLALLSLSSLLFFRHRRSIGNHQYDGGRFTR